MITSGMDDPDVTISGFPRFRARKRWGRTGSANETPVGELQLELVTYHPITFEPTDYVDLNRITTTTGLGDPPNAVQQVTAVYDFTETHPPFETTITLSSSKTPSAVGEMVAFMGEVTVIEPTAPYPIGTVGLRIDGGALQSIGPLHHSGAFAIPITTLTAGVHTIVAEYTPDSATYITSVSPSIQQTVT
jgi:hypothetical protein